MHSPAPRVKSITTFILTFVFLLLLSPNLALSQPSSDANAVKSGDWSDPTVWDTGSVPTAGIDVFIENNHTVTYDMPEDGDTAAEAKTITVRHGGVLKFSRNMSTRLDLDGSLMVLMHGTIDVGTKSSPIPAEYTATIGFNVPDDRLFTGNTKPGPNPDMPDFHPDDFGLWVMGMQSKGWFHGAEKNFIWTRLAQPAQKGANQLVLAEAPQGWRVGDQILITPTQENSKEVERRTITGISGDRLTLNQPLTYFHDSALYAYDKSKDKTRAISDPGQLQSGEVLVPVQAEVALLTQNVTITSNLVKEGDPNHRAHTLYMMGGTGNISYAEFRNLGPRAKLGRYPVHFHMLGGGASNFHLKAASIWQDVSDPSNKWVTVHATKDMTVEGCVGYNAQGRGYYLEDSVETGLQFIKNLGVLVHGPEELPKAHLEHIESAGAAVFWMREMNTFKDNVAVAAQPGAAGYWLTENTSGASVASVYENNVAHSNSIGFYGTADNKTLAAVTDFELWRNDLGVRTDNETIVDFKDALLYGNGTNISSGRVKLTNETVVPDHFRVPIIHTSSDDNRLWVNNASYRFYYTFYDGLLKVNKFKDFSLDQGLNELTITDTNYLGRSATRLWTTTLDTQPPIITISAAKNPPVTNDRVNPYILRYTVTDEGKQIPEYKLLQFEPGENQINATVQAKDLAGNTAQANYTVTYDPNYNPPAEDESNVTFTDGSITGSSFAEGAHDVIITVDDHKASRFPIPFLKVVKGQTTLKLDPNHVGDHSPAEFTQLQWMLNGNPISPVMNKADSITFDFVWDSTSVPDGTYGLVARFISGKELHAFKSSYINLVVDNVAGPRKGIQDVPAPYYRKEIDGISKMGLDYVSLPDFKVRKSASSHTPQPAPPAHRHSDVTVYQDPEVFYKDPAWHITSGNDSSFVGYYNSVDGHALLARYWPGLSPSIESAIEKDSLHDAHDSGGRGDVMISAFTTFAPDPEGDGWYGIDVTGDLFRADLDGTRQTIVGRVTRRDVIPLAEATLAETEAHQITYTGDFANGVRFKIPNDLYFDPHNPKILYVADTYNHRIARVDLNFSPPKVTTLAGEVGVAGYKDGVGTAAQFNAPYSLVVDWASNKDGTKNIYVADRFNQAIRKIVLSGPDYTIATVSTVVGKGSKMAAPAADFTEAFTTRRAELIKNADFDTANITFPFTIRMDSKRNLIVLENNTVSVRKVNFETGMVEFLSDVHAKFENTWTWLDVDWRGNIGPVDDYIVCLSQSKRDFLTTKDGSQIGSFNNLYHRHNAQGQLINRVAPNDTVTTHYPWAFAIDDSTARIISTGFGSLGGHLGFADPDRTPVVTYSGAFVRGMDNFERGTIYRRIVGPHLPQIQEGRPSFFSLYGQKTSGHTRLANYLNFDELVKMSDEDLGNYLQAGLFGRIPRPELTGYDLESLIYYIRSVARPNRSEARPSEPSLPADQTPPKSRNIRATQVGADRVKVTWWTDEPAIGIVRSGVQPGLYHSSSRTFSDGISYFHEVIVDGLSEVQVNYLRLLVKDIAGNIEEPAEFSFVLSSANAKNHPPVGNSQSISVEKRTNDNPSERNIQLTGSDVNGDPLTYSIGTPPQHGAISNLNSGAGTLIYTPTLDYEGQDSFTFNVSDGEFVSSATVNVTVTPIQDDPPTISSFTNTANDRDEKSGLQIRAGDEVTFRALASDPEGKPLNYSWSYRVNNGTPVVFSSGVGAVEKATFTFPDNAGGSTYTWILTVSDGTTEVSKSTVLEVLAAGLPPMLVGHWTFDEASGNTVFDSTKFANHGTLEGSGFSRVAGRIGGALHSTDVGGLINYGDRGSLKYTHQDAATMAMWIAVNETNDGSGTGYMFNKTNKGTRWRFGYKRGEWLETSFATTFNKELQASMPGKIPDPEVWNHVAMVFDGTDKDNDPIVKFYLNGVNQGANLGANGLTGSFDNSGDMVTERIGGTIDDACFYNYAVADSVIAELASGKTCNSIPEISTFALQANDRSLKLSGIQSYVKDSIILTSSQTDSDSSDQSLSYEVFYRSNSKRIIVDKGTGATSKTVFTVPSDSVGKTYNFYIEVTDGVDKVEKGPLSITVVKDSLAPRPPSQLTIIKK